MSALRPRQIEDPFGDDAEHDLAGAALDRVGLGAQPGARPGDANPYVTYPIPTGLGHARNILVVRAAQVVIAVGGKYGTLSEIAFAQIEGVPVIGLHTWELRREGIGDSILRATDPKEAVTLALEEARKRTA